MPYVFQREFRIRFFQFAFGLLVGTNLLFAAVNSADDKTVLDAVNAGLKTESEFKTVHEFISGNRANANWRNIGWHRDLWTARAESVKQNKPLFIWAMNGDPLGCV